MAGETQGRSEMTGRMEDVVRWLEGLRVEVR